MAGRLPRAFNIAEADSLIAAYTAPKPQPFDWEQVSAPLHHLAGKLGDQGQRVLLELVSAANLAAPAPSLADISMAMRPFSFLLDLVGADGVPLTAAGYLKPAVAEEIFTTLGMDKHWIGKGNREDLTQPIRHLRLAAHGLGLIRNLKGRLVLTPAGRQVRGDPTSLWKHVASALPLGRHQVQQDAGAIALLCVAGEEEGRRVFGQYAADLLGLAGWRFKSGEPVGESDAFESARSTWEVVWSVDPGVRRRREEAPAFVASLARAASRRA